MYYPKPTKLTVTLPLNALLGSFTGASISYFAGNSAGWIVLHFFCNWFYVAYKMAELLFGSATGA